MLIGYNLYLVQTLSDPQTGETWEDEPYYLRLCYNSFSEAEKVAQQLRPIYTTARIEIDCQSSEIPWLDGE